MSSVLELASVFLPNEQFDRSTLAKETSVTLMVRALMSDPSKFCNDDDDRDRFVANILVDASHNENTTWEFVVELCEKGFHDALEWFCLSHVVPVDEIFLHFDEHPWDHERVCTNPSLTVQDIVSTDLIEWGAYMTPLSRNPSVVTRETMETYIDRFDWDFYCLSSVVPMDIVRRRPEKPWDYDAMSSNPGLTWDFVEQHEGERWNWGRLAGNANVVTPDLLARTPTRKWDYQRLSANRSVSWKVVDLWDRIWDFDALSGNETAVNARLVAKNPRSPFWNWKVMSGNKSVATWEFVSAHLQYPWDWEVLTAMMKVDWMEVVKNIHLPWVWKNIAMNPLDDKKWKRALEREEEAALALQTACSDWIWSPKTEDGKPGINVRFDVGLFQRRDVAQDVAFRDEGADL